MRDDERPAPKHHDVPRAACAWLLRQRSIAAAATEVGVLTGVADVLGAGHLRKPPKLVIIECKANRADLLGDLRRGKMIRYSETASHCYLALGSGCPYDLVELVELGLPDWWGVLDVSPTRSPTHFHVASRRRARTRPGHTVTTKRVAGHHTALASSMSWRYLRLEDHIAHLAHNLRDAYAHIQELENGRLGEGSTDPVRHRAEQPRDEARDPQAGGAGPGGEADSARMLPVEQLGQ